MFATPELTYVFFPLPDRIKWAEIRPGKKTFLYYGKNTEIKCKKNYSSDAQGKGDFIGIYFLYPLGLVDVL